MTKSYDVLVIGSGPSGLLCSILASKKRKVTLVERDNQLGKRILVSGNGRCNFFNENLLDEHFFSPSVRDIVFDDKLNYAKEVLSFLQYGLKFPFIKEHDLYYPFFNRAESFRNILLDNIYDNQIRIENLNLLEIIPEKNEVIMTDTFNNRIRAKYNDLVLSIGGKSYDRDNFDDNLINNLSDDYKKFLPCLCPITTLEKIPKYMIGKRLRCNLSVYSCENLIYAEKGEIIFKKDGLSGICIFNATLKIIENNFKNISLILDYSDGLNKGTASIISIPDFLLKYIEDNNIEPFEKLKFSFNNLYSFKDSQYSYGGIKLNEINKHNLSLLKFPNIKVIGELLDVNYPCGGYNMGMCLIEGYKAGIKL